MEAGNIDHYNWQKDREDSWLKQILLWSAVALSQEEVAELSEATDGFTDVTVNMQVNGVEIPTGRLFKVMGESFHGNLNYRARHMVSELPGYSEALELCNDIHDLLREKVHQLRKELGYEGELQDWEE